MSSIFISNPITDGHSWTITSKLGHIIRTAEEKYGPRDFSYTILGVEFNSMARIYQQFDNAELHFVPTK